MADPTAPKTLNSSLTFNVKDFMYVCALVVSVTIAFATVRGDAAEAKRIATANQKQIEVNSKITAGYDVISVQLTNIDGRLEKIEDRMTEMEKRP